MKHFSHFVLPLTLLAMAGEATAQNLHFEPAEIYLLPVPGISSSAFTTSVAGHLQGHHLNDAVVLAGGRPVLVTAPGVHRSALPLPLPAVLPVGYVADDVRDLAILRGGGEEGRDALVVLTGAGLWTWYMSKELVVPEGGGAAELQWVVRVYPLGTSVWAGAKRLRVADVNNDGIDDVLGIMSAERAIRCLQRGAVGITWVITAAAHVRDFVVADLVPGGTPEIVAMTGPVTNSVPAFDGGLRVFAPGNSTDLARSPLVYASPVCAVLRAGTTTGVVVAGSVGTEHRLRSFKMEAGALVQCGVVDVGGEVTAVATGKWATASEDVLLTYRTTSNPAVVTHTGGLQFGLVRSMTFGSVTMTDNRAACLVADWHGDPAEPEAALHGDPLLLYPSTATGSIVLQQRTSFDNRFVTADGGLIGLGIAAPPDQRPTHVQIEAWGLTPGASGVTMTHATSTRELCLLNQSGQTWSIAPTMPDMLQAQAWHMPMRFVERNAAGTILRRWPARSAGLAFDVSWITYFMAEYPLLYMVPPFVAVPVMIPSFGITGDVVQPPAGPDTGDDDPPAPDPDAGG